MKVLILKTPIFCHANIVKLTLLKFDKAVGRDQFGSQRNFLNVIISKLDRHVVLLHVNCIFLTSA